MEELKNKVRQFTARQQLWLPGQQLLLALSGGMDSMLLLQYLLEEGIRPGLAHVNFQLRGSDADNDQSFVASVAASLQLPLYVHTENTAAFAAKEHMSLEEAAREIRYRFLYHIAYAHGYQRILTAHHARDHAETILLHQVRGSGARGLSGIPVHNQMVVRPFLCLRKAEVIHWSEAVGLTYCEDRTNSDTRFARNLIRHEVLPILEKLNPGLEETLLENGRIQRELQLLADQEADRVLKKVCIRKGDDLYIGKKALLLHPAARTILFRLLRPYGFTAAQLDDILQNHTHSGRLQEAGRFRLITDRTHWILTTERNNQFSWHLIREDDRHVHLPGMRLELRYLTELPSSWNMSAERVYLRADDLSYPLLIRPWKQGDYLYPFGLYKPSGKPARKKVSDLLTDKKLSLPEKERVLVLCSADRILWILGIRQDERTRITSGTGRILKIKMLPARGSMYY